MVGIKRRDWNKGWVEKIAEVRKIAMVTFQPQAVPPMPHLC